MNQKYTSFLVVFAVCILLATVLVIYLKPSAEEKFLCAIANGNIAEVTRMASSGKNFNFQASRDIPKSRLQSMLVGIVNHFSSSKSTVNFVIVGIGDTPLTIASRNDNAKLVELLLKHGADPNGKDSVGRSPIHWACYQSNWPIYDILKTSGASEGLVDPAGLTARNYWEKAHP